MKWSGWLRRRARDGAAGAVGATVQGVGTAAGPGGPVGVGSGRLYSGLTGSLSRSQDQGGRWLGDDAGGGP